MNRRASLAPEQWLHSLLKAMSLVACLAVAGCGSGGGGGGNGGGGGGGGTGDCGSAAGSVASVLCGNVVVDGTATAVGGATVILKNAAGQNLATTTTDGAGFYRFNTIPAGTALFQVDPPATGFHTRTARFGSAVYLYYITDQATAGPCLMATGAIGAGDRKLGNVGLFPDANPPPPAFGCPR